LKVANFSGNRVSSLTLDSKEKVIQEVNDSIDAAKKLKCDRIMLLSDILEGDGSVKTNLLSSEKNYFAYMIILGFLLRLLKRETLCW